MQGLIRQNWDITAAYSCLLLGILITVFIMLACHQVGCILVIFPIIGTILLCFLISVFIIIRTIWQKRNFLRLISVLPFLLLFAIGLPSFMLLLYAMVYG